MTRLRRRFSRRDVAWIAFSVGLVVLIGWFLPLGTRFRRHDERPYLFHWRSSGGNDYTWPGLHLGFDANDRIVSVDFKGVLRQWAMGTDQPVRTLKLQTPPPAVLGWNNDLVDISPDCHWAVVRGRDVTGSIWKNIGGKEVEISAHADLSPYFLIWDLWTGQLKTKLRCSHWEFGRAAFTPDGDWLASGGEREEFQVPTGHDKLPDGRSRGVVQVWDWRTGRSIWRWRLRSQVLALSWARNGVLAVAGADELIIHQPGKEVTSVPLVGEISIWRPGQRQCLMRKTLRFHAEEVAITPDAR